MCLFSVSVRGHALWCLTHLVRAPEPPSPKIQGIRATPPSPSMHPLERSPSSNENRRVRPDPASPAGMRRSGSGLSDTGGSSTSGGGSRGSRGSWGSTGSAGSSNGYGADPNFASPAAGSAFAVNEEWIVASATPVNIRTEPSLKSAAVGQKMHGDMVTASRRLAAGGGWIQLAEPINGAAAWMRIADGRRTLLTRVSEAAEQSAASAVSLQAKFWLVVCVSGCNVRDSPSLRGRTLYTQAPGDAVKALETSSEGAGWIRVAGGWMRVSDASRALLRPIDPQYRALVAGERYVVVAKDVELLAGPSTLARSVGRKVAGDIFQVVGAYQYDGTWLRLQEQCVTAEGPLTAWVPVTSANRETLLRRFVFTACDETWQVADSEPVKVRAGPSTNAPRLGTHDAGALVQVAGSVEFDGGWLKLKVAPAGARGRSAWMRQTNGRSRIFMRKAARGMLVNDVNGKRT